MPHILAEPAKLSGLGRSTANTPSGRARAITRREPGQPLPLVTRDGECLFVRAR